MTAGPTGDLRGAHWPTCQAAVSTGAPARTTALTASSTSPPPVPPPPPPSGSWSASSRASTSYTSPAPSPEPYTPAGSSVPRALPPRTSSHRDFRASAALASAFEPHEGPSPRSGYYAVEDRTRHSQAADWRSSSVPPSHPGLNGNGGPVTPRATAGASSSVQRDEETTPRGAGAGTAQSTPRSRVNSAPTPSHVSPPPSSAFGMHTPPMLLPRQYPSHPLSYDPPSRSSSRARLDLDADTTAPVAAGSDSDDGHSSASSSHRRAIASSSSEDEDAWAGTLLPSGSSPIQSPLLADMLPSSASSSGRHPPALALGTLRADAHAAERPVSEFDWAAAYAESRTPSLVLTPGAGSGPAGAREGGQDGQEVAGLGMPLIPLGTDGKEEAEPRKGGGGAPGPDADERERTREGESSGVTKRPAASLPDVDPPPSVGPSTLETHIPSSSFSSPSPSPSPSASPASAPAVTSPATAQPDAIPTSAATLFVPGSAHTSNGLDRPGSRASVRSTGSATSAGRRSPGPQPPRPARRQASALSLRSALSGGSGGAGEQGAAPAATEVDAPREAAGPAAALAASAEAEPTSPLPPTTGLSSPRPRNASGSSRRSGPAPSVPEKSARRMSRRLSVLGGSGPGSPVVEATAAAAAAGTGSARGSPKVDQGELAGDAGNRFSVTYSISDLALAYGRDSWAEYSLSSESDYPPSSRSAALAPAVTSANGHTNGGDEGQGGAPSRSSHFREPASASLSPEGSPPAPSDARDLRVDVGVASPPPAAREPAEGSPATPTRGDAKARAAAFLADLRRAKAANGQGEGEEAVLAASAGTATATEAAPAGAFEELVGPRQSSPAVRQPAAFTAEESPALPPLPPTSPLSQHKPPAVPNFVELSVHAPEGPPPVPPPHDSKRPSNAGSVATLAITRGPSATLIPPTATGAPSPPLLRRRALPQAVLIAPDLKRARTARERGRIYAEKINELGRERSRLDEWIAATREGRAVLARVPLAASPNHSRRASRQDASTATFAARGDGHGYRAKELPSSSFSPRDLAPANAPYPGVLHLGGGGASSSSRSGAPSSHSSGSKASFFSGLGRGSLGRRASKREHHSHLPGHGGSSTMTISAPVQLLSSTNMSLTSPSSTSLSGGVRPIHGPRMPQGGGTAQQERASLDAHYSPAGSPALPPPPPLPVRTSFSYGSSASLLGGGDGPGGLGGLAASASVPAHLGGAGATGSTAHDEEPYGSSGANESEADKLARLQDILPQASRDDLRDALARAGGDDVLAISIYLSEEGAA